jgi:hypothetical protein
LVCVGVRDWHITDVAEIREREDEDEG